MLVVITYDVNTTSPEGAKRLRKVAKLCVNYGVRVQNSVFECIVDSVKMLTLKSQLCKVIDLQTDSLRFYYLGNHYENKVEHIGAKDVTRPDQTLIL